MSNAQPRGHPRHRCAHPVTGRDLISGRYFCVQCGAESLTDFHASRLPHVPDYALRGGTRPYRRRARTEQGA